MQITLSQIGMWAGFCNHALGDYNTTMKEKSKKGNRTGDYFLCSICGFKVWKKEKEREVLK